MHNYLIITIKKYFIVILFFMLLFKKNYNINKTQCVILCVNIYIIIITVNIYGKNNN